jgi:phosphoserine phosphatase
VSSRSSQLTGETVLVRMTGPDGPGLLSSVLERLAEAGSHVQDIEQITIRGRLDLSLIATVPTGRDLLKELLLFGWEQQLDVTFEVVDPTPSTRAPGAIVTVLGAALGPDELGAATAAIAAAGGNIERIVRLAREPVQCYELAVAGGDRLALRSGLLSASRSQRMDVAVQDDGLLRRATRLVVMDVDSTLIQDEVIDLLADECGCGEQVAAITEAAMRGELDFTESLRRRVALLAGHPESLLDRVRAHIRLSAGARRFVSTLSRLGYRTAIVSGGFTHVTDWLRADLGLDHAHANVLGVRDGVLTGEVVGDIIDRKRKAELVALIAAAEGIALDQVVAVGDGANDLDMLAVAGLGIAFNAKPTVRDAADAALNVPYLDAILFLLGVRADDLVD